jgi:DNA-binding response OmpR family regulator
MNRKILIVEDDRNIAKLVETNLKDQNYEVSLAHDGNSGLDLALSGEYQLIILDLNLPDVDGLEICRQVRSDASYTPILMLTCRTSELDRVVGLEIGADDYLTKPFSVRELIARVKALFRRIDALESEQKSEDSSIILHGNLHIDANKREVTLKGNSINLTAKEFDLLYFFAKNPGRVYTRNELLDLVWGYAYKGYDHTVNSHINRLRAKIEEDQNQPRHIITVWGVGYKFVAHSKED